MAYFCSSFRISHHSICASVNPEPLPGIHICAPINMPSYYVVFWVPVISFEIVLVLLAIWKCIEHIKEIREMYGWNRRSLLNILLRDNIGYFFVYVAIYDQNRYFHLLPLFPGGLSPLTSALMQCSFNIRYDCHSLAICSCESFLAAIDLISSSALMRVITRFFFIRVQATWLEIPACFSFAATTIMGCRLVLNLSSAYYIPFSTQRSIWATELQGQSVTWERRSQEDASNLEMEPIGTNNEPDQAKSIIEVRHNELPVERVEDYAERVELVSESEWDRLVKEINDWSSENSDVQHTSPATVDLEQTVSPEKIV